MDMIHQNFWSKFLVTSCLLPWIAASACNKEKPNPEAQTQVKEDKKATNEEQKAEQKPEPSEQRDLSTSIDKPFEAMDISGPVPPEISMVFFTADGALTPLACYDKVKKTIEARANCLSLLEKGSEVYLKSRFSAVLDKVGDPKNALCEVGDEGSPKSLSTSRLDEKQAFDWAVWPKSSAQKVVEVSPESQSESVLQRISNDELTELQTAIKSIRSGAEDNKVTLHQLVELDIDGDKQPERVYSAFIVNPNDTAAFLFSGLLVKFAKDPKKFVVVEKTQTSREVFTLKGAIDVNGDGIYELWINAAFDEGGGDRMVELKGSDFKPLSSWTCGL